MLVSPWRLNLALFCTYGTPVRKHLGCLPPLPIIVDYLTFWDNKSPAPNYEDDIIAALEHPDRVRSIKLAVTSSLLEVAAPVLQEPFSALTTLWLSSKDPDAPVVPDISSSGPAPHLWQIMLEGISFPRLPTLLSSASNLVDLQLKDIPQSGYISPEVMATSLAPLNRLYSLCICFKAPISRLYIRSSPASTRHVLNLVTFNFRGSSEYLEHLLAQIDTPRLHGIIITYFNQLDFQVPQLSEFVRRTEHLELAQSRYSQGRMRISSLYVELDFEDEGRRRSGFTLRISCKWPDWQVSHLAQILGQFPALVSNVDHLSIDEDDPQLEPGWKDSMDDTDWIELLHPFTAVKKLHGSRQLAQHIALALGSVSGEMITEILPALSSLSLEDQPVRPVEKFLAARQISGHPVNFVDPGECEFMSCKGSFWNASFLTALGSATNSEVIQFSGSSLFLADRSGTKRHDPTDLLVDGFIARTFGSEDANGYLMHLLRVPSSKHFLQYYGILHHEGAWYITHNNNLVQGTSPCVPLQPTPLLDYSATAYGAVVPQRRWTPADEVYVRRQTVESAALQLPIFFVNHDGHLGFWLPDILKDFYHDLHNANEAAPLGGRAFAHIRIHVSLCY